jgi:RHS repeat-associated protein
MDVNSATVASYAYDPNVTYGGKIGNMTSKTEGATTYNFSYAAEHIHAPTNLGYDKNGNSIGGGGDLYWFDVENRLSQINAWTWTPMMTTYLYDGSGGMVRRNAAPYLYPDQAEKDVFVDGIYQERSIGCAAASSYTKYYSALGRVIASRTGTIGGSSSLSFYAADRLGSTSTLISGADGSIESTIKYWPFGSVRSTTNSVPERAYTGQQQEPIASSNLGLYYYKARFYSTGIGRFISADPTGDTLNRYSYVSNNPLRFTDPSGLDAAIFCGTGNRCESGGDADNFRSWVIQYWKQREGIFAGMEDSAFALLIYVLANGWGYEQTLAAFHVAFIDTTGSLKEDGRLAAAERSPWYDDGLEHWQNVFWDKVRQ